MMGMALLKSIMAERQILNEKDFFESRYAEHVRARRDIMRILYRAGHTKSEIARLLRCDEGTVRYWVDSDARKANLWRRAVARGAVLA